MVAPPLLDVQSSLVCHWFLDAQTKTLIFLLECHWILDHFDFNQDWILIEYYCKQTFQGRDTTRASHTSRL